MQPLQADLRLEYLFSETDGATSLQVAQLERLASQLRLSPYFDEIALHAWAEQNGFSTSKNLALGLGPERRNPTREHDAAAGEAGAQGVIKGSRAVDFWSGAGAGVGHGGLHEFGKRHRSIVRASGQRSREFEGSRFYCGWKADTEPCGRSHCRTSA